MSIFIIQYISTWWTRASRGAPMACVRNAVPTRITISHPVPKDANRLFHARNYSESNGFEPDDGHIIVNEHLWNLGSVTFKKTEEGASVLYNYTLACGLPHRFGMRAKLFSPLDRWCQVVSIGRFKTYEYNPQIYYWKGVKNVGLFTSFDPECFLKSDPIEQFSALGDLW